MAKATKHKIQRQQALMFFFNVGARKKKINVEANWWSVGNNKLNNVAMLLLVMMLNGNHLKSITTPLSLLSAPLQPLLGKSL